MPYSRSLVIHLNIALTFVSFTSHLGHHFSRLPEIKFIVPHTESYCSSFLPFLIIINIFLVYFILFYFIFFHGIASYLKVGTVS